MISILDPFIKLGLLGIIAGIALLIIYLLLGAIREPYVDEAFKTTSYTGGKELSGRKTTFRTLFFQYAIYFLIFDVVAFVTAIVSFGGKWKLFDEGKINPTSLHVLAYLSIIVFLFIIIPKQEEEVV